MKVKGFVITHARKKNPCSGYHTFGVSKTEAWERYGQFGARGIQTQSDKAVEISRWMTLGFYPAAATIEVDDKGSE